MLDIVLAPLALTPKTFAVGDTVRVTVSFKYAAGVNTTMKLFAGPYYTNNVPPFKHMVDSCVGKADVSLIAAATPTAQTASVDFTLLAKAQGGIENGTYGLRVWVEGTDAVAEQDGIITVSGNPTDILSSILPLMIVMMIMGMIVPMMMGKKEEE